MHLKSLTNLSVLHLDYTKISDAGLVHLKSLINLTYLNLKDTKISRAGIAKIRKALPNCKIYY